MTPSARTQAAIELLDAILLAAREGGAAADTLIARYFATRRYAGSKDRRAVRELVYAAIRRAGEPPVSGRAALLGVAADSTELTARFDGTAHAPVPLVPGEPVAPPGVAPGWLERELERSGLSTDECTALVARAPLDLRVNTLLTTRDEALAALPGAELIAGLPDALRLATGTSIEAHELYRSGAVEVQDAGSQLIAFAVAAEPDMRVVDLCAGAGGKTLALAAAMRDTGELLACDTDRARLSRLVPRTARAGATCVTTRLLDPNRELAALEDWRATADVVLVDAPCSGTGTWRRNPEARWRLSPARLERLRATQAHVLDLAAALVRPGGVLVYAVCSVLDGEGPDQVAALVGRTDLVPEPLSLPFGAPRGPGVRLTPARDGTDGFFVARLRRA